MSGDVPKKAGEFARNGNTDLVDVHFSQVQATIAMREAQLCSPGDLADGSGLTFLTYVHEAAQARWKAVIPGCLDENAPRVTIASFSDASATA